MDKQCGPVIQPLVGRINNQTSKTAGNRAYQMTDSIHFIPPPNDIKTFLRHCIDASKDHQLIDLVAFKILMQESSICCSKCLLV